VTGAIEQPGTALSRQRVPGEPRPGGPGTDIVRPAARPHGLIAIYTLLEDKVAAFDRIAEEAAEQVRAQEPDTLVYVIHTVPKAPMQRIFYEIYRDRAAYERHEQQSHIKRFVTARRPYVLATNVIELRLKYAKISPLVQDETQVPSPAAASSAGASSAGASSAGASSAGAFSAGVLPRSAGPAPVRQALPPGYGGAPSADYGGWRRDDTGGWDDGRRGDGARHWGGGRRGDGARDWGDRRRGDGPGDARVAGGRRGRGQLPPPVPPRGYGGI
jgi:quinol monooxygenase YgiN